MIKLLKIKNFALIKDSEIQFDNGFNVVVGSTGSGKSLVVKALNFAFGAKPSKFDIRCGESKMIVQVVLESNAVINEMLAENDIDVNDDVIIQRSYTIDGKSDIRINGYISTVQFLKQISGATVEAYAQNENVELLSQRNQLRTLDEFCVEDINEILCEIKETNSKLLHINKSLASIGGDETSRAREIDLLSYQVNEIESANISIGEDDDIKERLDVLNSYERISEISKNILSEMSEVVDYQMSDVLSNFSSISSIDKTINELNERFRSAYYDTKDIYESFKDYIENLVFDEDEYIKLDSRMELIKSLKKKYGNDVESILNYLKQIKSRIDELNDGASMSEKLTIEKQHLCHLQYDLCKNLSNIRRKNAISLQQIITKDLSDVGMKNALFEIRFAEFPDFSEDLVFSDVGLDKIEFLFSANAGQGLKSLSKTSSGGELSRLMLTIKNILAKNLKNGTFIFDEIDTGISGQIGYLVAKKIANISKNNQIICITHLPQVTAMADNYIKIDKYEKDGQTYSVCEVLYGDKIISYIASMFGADQITNSTILTASELKEKSEDYKHSI